MKINKVMKLIDKAALVAEIEKRIKKYATLDVGNSRELDALYGAKCKALTEILSFLDTLEVKEVEESVSEDLEKAANTYVDNWYKLHNLDKESYPIDVEISKNDFKAGANWQKLQDMGITDSNAKDTVAGILNSSDNPLDAYATEITFMMLPATLKENYHNTNRDRISDAVKLGAKWQKEHLWKPADGDDLPEIDREVIAIVEVKIGQKLVFAHRPKKHCGVCEELYDIVRYDKGGWNQPNVKWWLDAELPKM